jgi:hypothetical protein
MTNLDRSLDIIVPELSHAFNGDSLTTDQSFPNITEPPAG